MCGVFGVRSPGRDVARLAYFGLFALQHRGQESAGIAVSGGGRVTALRDVGLVAQVFSEQKLRGLDGDVAIGHTRYSTTGSPGWANAQPIVKHGPSRTIALATASSSGASSPPISAAMTSVSEDDASGTPTSCSSSRKAAAFTRLPLWPSETVRARPWWTSGWAFAHLVPPVVE